MRKERQRIRGKEIEVKESPKKGHHGRGEHLGERIRVLYMNPKKKPEKLVTLEGYIEGYWSVITCS